MKSQTGDFVPLQSTGASLGGQNEVITHYRSASSETHAEPSNRYANPRKPHRKEDEEKTKSASHAGARPEDRYAVIQIVKTLQQKASELCNASESDPVSKGIAGADITQLLTKLWSYRQIREEGWQSIVNFIQIALSGVIFENMPSSKCAAIERSVRFLAASADRDDVKSVVRVLKSAGFDPWQGISQTTQDASE